MCCQALQQQSQDVLNVMILVRATKTLIQELRKNGWDKLYANVTSYCVRHDFEIPNLDDTHSAQDMNSLVLQRIRSH